MKNRHDIIRDNDCSILSVKELLDFHVSRDKCHDLTQASNFVRFGFIQGIHRMKVTLGIPILVKRSKSFERKIKPN